MSSIIIYANGLTIDMDRAVIPDGVYPFFPSPPTLPSWPSAGGSLHMCLLLIDVLLQGVFTVAWWGSGLEFL